MNNTIPNKEDEEMLPEYDFSSGLRGKHVHAYQSGYKVTIHKIDGSTEEQDYTLPDGAVILDPAVRTYFPDAEAVNTALRGLIQLIPHNSTSNETS